MKRVVMLAVPLLMWVGFGVRVHAQPSAFLDLSLASEVGATPTPHSVTQPVSRLEVTAGGLVRVTVGFRFEPFGDVTRWYVLGALLQVDHPALEVVTPHSSDISQNAFWHPDMTQQAFRLQVKAAVSAQTQPLRANLLRPDDANSAVFSQSGALWVVLAPGGHSSQQAWYVGHVYLRVREDTPAGTQIPLTLASVPDAVGVLPNSLLATDGARRYYHFGEDLPVEVAIISVGQSQTRVIAHVALQDYLGSVEGQPVEVQVRPAGDTVPLETHRISLDANSSLQLITSLRGVYDVSFKGGHWLRRTVPGVQLSGTVHLETSLQNGDIDGDNEVSLFDFGMLVAAFGSMPGDSTWNANADLDGDEEVSLFDFGILVRNFGAIGDE
ncbi:MAG: dockerin type I domain-containing protein [Armatimonadota bacterium]